MVEESADRLDQLHKDLGYSIKNLATDIGISEATIRKVRGRGEGAKINQATHDKIKIFYEAVLEKFMGAKEAEIKAKETLYNEDLSNLELGQSYTRDFISEYTGVPSEDRMWSRKVKLQLEKRGYEISIKGKQSTSRVIIEKIPNDNIQHILDNAWGVFKFDGHRANVYILAWIIYFLENDFEDFNNSPMPLREEIIKRHAGIGCMTTIHKWFKKMRDINYITHESRGTRNWWTTDWSNGCKIRRKLDINDPYDKEVMIKFFDFVEKSKKILAIEQDKFDLDTESYSNDFVWGYEQVRAIRKIFMDTHHYTVYKAPETKIIPWAKDVADGRLGKLITASLDLIETIIKDSDLDDEISNMFQQNNHSSLSYKSIVNNQSLQTMVQNIK